MKAVRRRRLSAVDVFAGGGGLSLGATRAGFSVRTAVELDPEAATTYRRNHPGVLVLERDVREVHGRDLVDQPPNRELDLLMGCAPCQGFCSLTLKNRTEDPRNRLVLEMARLIEETTPTAVIMENVAGLATRGRVLLQEFLERLRAAGYRARWWIVQMADYGVPQNRRRLVLLAGHGFEISLPGATHARMPKPGSGRQPWRTLRDVIDGERVPATLSAAWRNRGPQVANWHIVRDLEPQTRRRLRAALPGRTRLELGEDLLPACHRGNYEGFRNVYTRMAWDQLPVTITAGCTTPAKGRFGHPDPRRTTISVREAATIQTFPKGYRFASHKIDRVCEMIGNAVPPLFAEALCREALRSIRAHHARLAGERI